MEDKFGHQISYLRISVTDRCNERCHYCLPEDPEWLPRADILSYEEIERVVRVGAGLGIRKLRVTGGEPLTRRDLIPFLKRLTEIDGIEDLGLSTNGTLLSQPVDSKHSQTRAEALFEAGVKTVNISLDTLNREFYEKVTGRDFFDQAVAGIDAVSQLGFEKIKLNSVLMRNRNEHELPELIQFAQEKNCLLRFIEMMPVSTGEVLNEGNFFSVGEAKKLIEFQVGELEPLPEFRTNGPASYYRFKESGQIIGFIGAMTNLHFCETCNKLRLTCEGKLRPCLGSHLEFDMREVLRDPNLTDTDVEKFFMEVVARKPEQHEFRENYQPGRRMIAIGG